MKGIFSVIPQHYCSSDDDDDANAVEWMGTANNRKYRPFGVRGFCSRHAKKSSYRFFRGDGVSVFIAYVCNLMKSREWLPNEIRSHIHTLACSSYTLLRNWVKFSTRWSWFRFSCFPLWLYGADSDYYSHFSCIFTREYRPARHRRRKFSRICEDTVNWMDWIGSKWNIIIIVFFHFFSFTIFTTGFLSRKTFSNDGNMKSFNCFSPKLNLIDNSNFIFYACVNHLSFFFKFLLYFIVFTSLYSRSSGNGSYITDAWQYEWADGRSVCVTTNKFWRRKNNAIMRFFFSFRWCSRHFRIIYVAVVYFFGEICRCSRLTFVNRIRTICHTYA